MAIHRMNRFSLLTFLEHKPTLLKELQKFGDVHFKELKKEDISEDKYEFLQKDGSSDATLRYQAELSSIQDAIVSVTPYKPKTKITAKRPRLTTQEFDEFLLGYDYQSVQRNIAKTKDSLLRNRAEIIKLNGDNEGLKAWEKLDVSPTTLNSFSTVKSSVGVVHQRNLDKFILKMTEDFNTIYIEKLGEQKGEISILLLHPLSQLDEVLEACKNLGFSSVTLPFKDEPSKIIKENEKKILKLKKQIEIDEEAFTGFGKEYENLLITKDCISSLLSQEKAVENFLKTGMLVLCEGWVPTENLEEFEQILSFVCNENFHLEQAPVEKDSEDVPIKLKNNKIFSAFEGITTMYSLPKYHEFDPTPIMAPFYWLFFGMMVGDAGYGVVVVIGTLLALKFLDQKESTRNFMRFFTFLGIATILCGGLIYGSFFGHTIFAPIKMADGNYKAILDSNLDITTMLISSVALGVIQIFAGLVVRGALALKNGDILGAIFDGLFWIIALSAGIGMLLCVTTVLPREWMRIMTTVFFAMLIILFFTEGRASKSIGGKIGSGIYGVYGISGYVGDFISYTRIAALALSGSYIGFSFNLIAGMLPKNFLGSIGSFAIMLAGHSLNLGLSLLGAYVHTSRLQYVEFFDKFYEGGAVPFTPLKIQNNYINIVKK